MVVRCGLNIEFIFCRVVVVEQYPNTHKCENKQASYTNELFLIRGWQPSRLGKLWPGSIVGQHHSIRKMSLQWQKQIHFRNMIGKLHSSWQYGLRNTIQFAYHGVSPTILSNCMRLAIQSG